VTLSNCFAWKEFIDFINDCVVDMKKDPTLNKAGIAGAYGMGEMIPNKDLLSNFFYLHTESLLDI